MNDSFPVQSREPENWIQIIFEGLNPSAFLKILIYLLLGPTLFFNLERGPEGWAGWALEIGFFPLFFFLVEDGKDVLQIIIDNIFQRRWR